MYSKWSHTFRHSTLSCACEQGWLVSSRPGYLIAVCAFSLPDLAAAVVLPQQETDHAFLQQSRQQHFERHQPQSNAWSCTMSICHLYVSPWFIFVHEFVIALCIISICTFIVGLMLLPCRLSCCGHVSRRGEHRQLRKRLSRPSCLGWSSS